MNWSGAALKVTIGAGTLAVVAVIADLIVPYIGIYGMIAFVLVPVTILILIKPGEIADRYVKGAHIFAALWYLGMVGFSFGFMVMRGFGRSDILMGGMMVLGFIPLFVIGRNFLRGDYDGAHDALNEAEEWFDVDN